MKPRQHQYSNQPHLCSGGRVKKYADGGEVKKSKKKKASRVRQDASGNTQSESVGSTADTLRNRRAQQMEAMGLKDGGKVNPLPPPKKGPKPKKITAHGNTQRNRPRANGRRGS